MPKAWATELHYHRPVCCVSAVRERPRDSDQPEQAGALPLTHILNVFQLLRQQHSVRRVITASVVLSEPNAATCAATTLNLLEKQIRKYKDCVTLWGVCSRFSNQCSADKPKLKQNIAQYSLLSCRGNKIYENGYWS